MTLAQMAFFGYEPVDLDSPDCLLPEVQSELLRGKLPFQCTTCGEITCVRVGFKQDDMSEDNIHFHFISDVDELNQKLDVNHWE